jgi:hypothetical protein
MKYIITDSQSKKTLKSLLEKFGMKTVCKMSGKTPKEIIDEIGLTGTKEDIIYLTKIIFEKDIAPTIKYCSYNIIPTRHSMDLVVYIAKPLPENEGKYMYDQRIRNDVNEHVSVLLYRLNGGIIRGHNVEVHNTGNC